MHHTERYSGAEKAKRMAVVGNTKIGRYACLSLDLTANSHYTNVAKELSIYVVKMISLGLGEQLEKKEIRLEQCLKMMLSLDILKE